MGVRGDEMVGLMLRTRVALLLWRIIHQVSTKFVEEVE